MGENSAIGWTTHTFNIAWGCTEIGPGCDNCYAREFANRYGYKWGTGAPRRYFGDKHWSEPLKWDRRAKETGETIRVFCSSMADILDNEVEDSHRERLWELIEATPNLTWQLLTKRIGNAKKMMPNAWVRNGLPKWVHFGITVVNQEEAARDIPKLLDYQGLLWLSIEPQLARINLAKWLGDGGDMPGYNPSISWVVDGGESGAVSKVRPFDIGWARSILKECRTYNVPCFIKQMGARTFMDPADGPPLLRTFSHEDAANPEKWPEDLRVQCFPE